MYFALCFALGTMYFDLDKSHKVTQDRVSLLFFSVGFFSFMSISAMPFFVEERMVFLRERMNNHYATITYVLAEICYLQSIV